MGRARISVVLAVAAAAGCGARPHVQLSPPPAPGAPVGERLGAYERHRPATITYVPARREHERRITSVILGSGKRVFHAEDLAVVVGPRSATAVSGWRSAEASASASRWHNIAWGMIAVGAALVVTSIQVTRDELASGPFIAPGIVLALGGGGVHIYARARTRESVRDGAAAFETYDEDLRGNLGLCVDGLRVVDCGGAKPKLPPR